MRMIACAIAATLLTGCGTDHARHQPATTKPAPGPRLTRSDNAAVSLAPRTLPARAPKKASRAGRLKVGQGAILGRPGSAKTFNVVSVLGRVPVNAKPGYAVAIAVGAHGTQPAWKFNVTRDVRLIADGIPVVPTTPTQGPCRDTARDRVAVPAEGVATACVTFAIDARARPSRLVIRAGGKRMRWSLR